jgi:tight adherence protein B
VTACLLAAALALLAWPARPSPVRRLGGPRPPLRAGGLVRPSPLLAGCAAAGVGAVLSTPLVAVLAGGCAALGCRAVLSARRRDRGAGRLLLLAEAVGVLVAELAAGRPVPDAAATAAAACPDQRTARELRAAVLPDGDDRLDPVLARVRAAARLSGRTGCSLTAVLAAVEDDLRARHRRLLELRSATAGPRAAAALLAGLPLLGLAMGSGVGAHPWGVLTTTAAGQALLVAGVVLEVAGVAWTGRLVRRAAEGGGG